MNEEKITIQKKGIIYSFFEFIFKTISFIFKSIFKYRILTILFVAFIVILIYIVLLSKMFL